MYHRMSKAFDAFENVCYYISAACAGLIMIMVSSDVLARYIFNWPIMGVVEFVEEYFMVLLVFLALSTTYKKGYHLKVELLSKQIPHRVKKVIDPIIIALIFIIILLILITSWNSFVQVFQSWELSVGMIAYPLAPAFFFVPIGCALLCIRLIRDFIMCFRDGSLADTDHLSMK